MESCKNCRFAFLKMQSVGRYTGRFECCQYIIIKGKRRGCDAPQKPNTQSCEKYEPRKGYRVRLKHGW